MSLSSDEINFLIYRYLRESGFEHSAYAFGHESFIYKTSLDGSSVPPGALISFVQKGLQYCEIESHINDDGSENICEENFNVLRKHICKIRKRKKIYDPFDSFETDYGNLELDESITIIQNNNEQNMLNNDENNKINQNNNENNNYINNNNKLMTIDISWNPVESTIIAFGNNNGIVNIYVLRDPLKDNYDNELMNDKNENNKYNKYYIKLSSIDTNTLINNNNNNDQDNDMLQQSTKRQKLENIINNDEKQQNNDLTNINNSPLNHSIVSISWHPKGKILAIGNYSGLISFWKCDWDQPILTNISSFQTPRCIKYYQHHLGPITSIIWNTSGTLCTSCGIDGIAIFYDNCGEDILTRLEEHSGPILDIDWFNEEYFASSSTDYTIRLYQINNNNITLLHKLIGHSSDVNCIKFDPTGKYLASGSDDKSIRIWNIENGQCEYIFTDHNREITCLSWSNILDEEDKTFLNNNNTHQNDDTIMNENTSKLLLASGSTDCTIRIYDINNEGKQLYKLTKHAHPIINISFQSGNSFLLTISHERLHLWSINDGTLVKTFKTQSDAGVNTAKWDNTGRRIAVAYADYLTYILDLKQ